MIPFLGSDTFTTHTHWAPAVCVTVEDPRAQAGPVWKGRHMHRTHTYTHTHTLPILHTHTSPREVGSQEPGAGRGEGT